MRKATCKLFGAVAVAAVSFGMAGCNGGPRETDESGRSTEAAVEPAGVEGAGEHAGGEGTGEHEMAEDGGEHERVGSGGEHGDEGEHGEKGSGEEGEESGERIAREETWDATRRGARLVLSFDPASNAFVGTVENTTRQTLCAVRVEVHLSTGTELGPTARRDLAAGETTAVELPTGGEAFDTWTAHPEVSPCAGG